MLQPHVDVSHTWMCSVQWAKVCFRVMCMSQGKNRSRQTYAIAGHPTDLGADLAYAFTLQLWDQGFLQISDQMLFQEHSYTDAKKNILVLRNALYTNPQF